MRNEFFPLFFGDKCCILKERHSQSSVLPLDFGYSPLRRKPASSGANTWRAIFFLTFLSLFGKARNNVNEKLNCCKQ